MKVLDWFTDKWMFMVMSYEYENDLNCEEILNPRYDETIIHYNVIDICNQ